jgi:diaminopimelate decarboxylase
MNALHKIHTPFFLYDLDLFDRTLDALTSEANKYGYIVHYALKANNQKPLVERIISRGLGADCVSGDEVSASLQHGCSPDMIVFAGVGKTDSEIMLALDNDIYCLNCESVEELAVISELAEKAGKVARVALRVNPDVDAETHRNITTGRDENKFGIHLMHLQEALDLCRNSESLNFIGLHFHIGSQIMLSKPFALLCERVNLIWNEFRIEEYGATMLNLGGGLGIDYNNPDENPIPDFNSFFNLFATNLNIPKHISVHFELGRSIVGQSAKLITKVLFVKKGINKQFIIADAGMTELLRPALYQAVHKIDNLNSQGVPGKYDVVGPACESSDVFATELLLPETKRGDLLAIHSCGAYAQSMSLHYNLREKAPAYYIHKGMLYTEDSLLELLQPIVV